MVMVCALCKHNDTRVLFMVCPLSTHSNTLVVLKIWVKHREGNSTCAWHSYKPTRLYLVTEVDAQAAHVSFVKVSISCIP